MARQTKGYCKYCGKEYTRGGMLKHLATCGERKASWEAQKDKKICGYYELLLYGKYDKDYWLIIEMAETATLKELDQFIRDIWVECCGHLSSFSINGISYDSTPDEDNFWGPPSKSMQYQLKNVLDVGTEFGYEYDFGSTTELVIKVQNYREGRRTNERVTLLSRNQPPKIMCSHCGENEAKWVQPEGYYDGTPFWCEDCIVEMYEEDSGDDEQSYKQKLYSALEEDFYLPVCNSPRMGTCGYCGSERYPERFEPDKKIAGKNEKEAK